MISIQIPDLIPLFICDSKVRALAGMLSKNDEREILVSGLRGSSIAAVFAALSRMKEGKGRVFLMVADDKEEAGYLYNDLAKLLGENVLFFPSSLSHIGNKSRKDIALEILRTDILEKLLLEHNEVMCKQIAKPNPPELCRVKTKIAEESANNVCLYIVSYPEALAEGVPRLEILESQVLKVYVGDCFDLMEFTKQLVALGFKRKDYVYEPGEYALRGSILDVFSYSSEYPLRIDFYGDEVESIRTFEVGSQLSIEKKTCASIVGEMDQESGMIPFTDYLPKDALVISRNLVYIAERISYIYRENITKFTGDEKVFLVHEQSCSPGEEFLKAAERRQRILIENGTQFSVSGKVCPKALTIHQDSHQKSFLPDYQGTSPRLVFRTHEQGFFHKNFILLEETLHNLQLNGFRIFFLTDNLKQAERLKEILAQMCSNVVFTPVIGTIHEGFSDEDLKIACFTDHQIFDRFHKYNLRSERAKEGKMALSLKEILQFTIGDYVVHVDHGVGRFSGLVRLPAADGFLQEMMKLTYKNGDAVYVSIHSLHKVSKYRGKDGEPPKMSALGTGAWERMKERTKKKIKDIARDLIRLYSERRASKGFAFSDDTFIQQEIEASFEYEDTRDQLRVTREVKADMENERPMDRLVCGDVGFGKTEIAIRAALKAACDNKQVAVLVPTTILALQHFQTFSERLKNVPVRVDYLSRARTPTQTKSLLEDLESGKIQILIGTHKLISKSVKWHDLGLLIIDEEQKFGVAVKEKIRQMKINIDTLTMSATPIPRTLQFSLMGARDLSMLQTPPSNRRPIRTELCTFSNEVIAEAVRFELGRNGQTFIVSHRVAALQNLASIVHDYVPEARVVIGHGQMPPEELEKVVIGFFNHDFDVLISTTIVENGVDIPNANTIIIVGAHHFGLSDLHQMRGRVGRSDRQAFCFLLAPDLSVLSQETRRRLQAIENFSDLGSGMHIAMQDLDIRGAGNLLGAEQSGFIADLGYETYQKILTEAISELKNDEFSDLYADEIQKRSELSGELFVEDCTIDCDVHAYFPETYVPGTSERMMLYRELDGLNSKSELSEFRKRLEDRFGKIPEEGEELLRIVPLRCLGRKVGVEKIVLKNQQMILYFVSNPESAFYKSSTFDCIIAYATKAFKRCKFGESGGKRRLVFVDVKDIKSALELLSEMAGTYEF